MAFVKAATKGDLPPGAIREYQMSGKAIAVANVDGKFYAINSLCLHHAGPLGEGEMEGQMVTCPWHGWQYDVTTGKLLSNPDVGVDCYPIELRGDEIFVDAG
jgi:nitrite reductase (NADH) small subunit